MWKGKRKAWLITKDMSVLPLTAQIVALTDDAVRALLSTPDLAFPIRISRETFDSVRQTIAGREGASPTTMFVVRLPQTEKSAWMCLPEYARKEIDAAIAPFQVL